MKLLKRVAQAAVAAVIVLPGVALADTYGFYNISANNVADAAIGEAQLSVDVLDAGGGQVKFLFHNSGPSASSITDVYFDDGTLLAIASIDNSSSGVAFTQLAHPSNLPAANDATPPFVTTQGFSADSDPPTQPNGVNPGEYVGITFDLQGGQVFADTLDALTSGALRIGIHVQGFASGGSESFVNNPSPVPIPAAAWLFGSALVGVGSIARRKRNTSAA